MVILSDSLRRARFCWLVWLLLISLMPVDARAQLNSSGGVIISNGGATDTLAVRYLIESSSSDSHGWLHVKITSTGPSSRERNLELRLYTTTEESGEVRGALFKRKVTLAEGASKLETSVPFFFHSESSYSNNQRHVLNWDLGVFEDGRDIEDARDVQNSTALGSGYTPLKLAPGERPDYFIHARMQMNSTALHLMDIDGGPSATEATLIQEMQSGNSNSRNLVSMTSAMTSDLDFDLTQDPNRLALQRHINTAPDQWQYYLQFRMIVINVQVFQRLQEINPGALAAIKKYVAAGGNMVVTGSPGRDARLAIGKWLGEDLQGKSMWQPIHAPSQLFTEFDVPQTVTSTMQSSLGGATMPPGVVTRQFAMQGMAAPADAVNEESTVKPLKRISKGPGGPLTRSGFLRDGLLMANLWWQSRTTQHEFVRELIWTALTEDELGGSVVDIYGNVIDPRTGTIVASGGTEAETNVPTSPSKLLVDWNSVITDGMQVPSLPLLSFDLTEFPRNVFGLADNAISSIEKFDPSGISIRSFALGRIAIVEPGLDDYSGAALYQLSDRLTLSIASRTNGGLDGAWNVRNMIESVGKPPVWAFCGIVLLFGLALGPGLLILTGWIGRRSLMILLVPLLSVVTTGLIVGYEMLYEGFDTTVRLTSVLAIDGVSGEGFAWSRQTYFSGWPPREGQVFPQDVYFRPVNPVNPYYYRGAMYQPRHPRDVSQVEVAYRDSDILLTGGLKPRQQTQFLVGHPLTAKSPISVANAQRTSIEIKNETAHDLPFVLIRGGQNDYYFAEQLGAGQTAVLQKQRFSDISGSLSRLRADYLPVEPQGVRGGWWGSDNSIGQDIIDIEWVTQLNEQEEKSLLPPYGFVTLQPAVPEVFVPVKGEVVESKTLTIGRLAW